MAAQIGKLNRNLKDSVRLALGVTGLAILEDINEKEPKPPFETAYLRGSQFLYVFGKLKSVPNAKTKSEDGKYTNNPPAEATTKAGEFTLEVGLNTPYALYQHEELGVSISPRTESKRGTPKDTTGVNGKFLELKLLRYKDEYAGIFAREFTKNWEK